MSKLTTRITALLLSGILVIGSVPGSVLAASTDVDPGQTSEIAQEVYEEDTGETPVTDGEMAETEETSEDSVGAGETSVESNPEESSAEEVAVQYYTVTLDANGGYFENEWDDAVGDYTQQSEVVEKHIPVDGTVAAFPVHINPDGQTMLFAGWSLERDGELVIMGDEEYAPVDNCVLYAVWQAEDAALGETWEQEVVEDNSEQVDGTQGAEEVEDAITAEEGIVEEDTASEANTDPETENEQAIESDQEAENSDEEEIGENSSDSAVEEAETHPELNKSSEEEEIVREEAANGVIESGTCGDNLTWTLDEEGTLIISGTGAMDDYLRTDDISKCAPWKNYIGNIKKVIIDNGVTSIGDTAFADCSGLISIEIPDTLTSIGNGAFASCTNIKRIEMPDSCLELGLWPFNTCTSLEEVHISSNISQIPSATFYDCNKLSSVTIPERVTRIDDVVFFGCTSLSSIYFNGNAPTIDSNAFTNVTATAYYPANDPTWTEDVRQNYGGNITWVEWDPETGTIITPAELFAPVDSEPIVDGVFNFRSMLNNDNNISYTFNYDDAWVFSNSSTDRYKLLKTSIRVAMAAAGKGGEGDCGPDNIKNMMDTMGFKYTPSSIRYDVPEYDSIGSAIGLKNIKNSDGTNSSVILVALRGGGYGIEWGGDFRVGSSEKVDHEGFRIAADEVETRLKNFVDQNRDYINNDVRVWFVGFSRAAATSNLVASDLVQRRFIIDGISPGDIRAFCFECPKNAINEYADHSGEENIINIVNPIDFVPKVAFNNWGFSRYGKTYYIPSKETTSSYNESYKYQMIWKYQDLCEYNNNIGIEVTENEIVEVSGQASLLDDYFDYLSGFINRQKFNNEYEDVFISIAAGCLGGGSSPNWGDAVPKLIKALGFPVALRPITTGRVIGLFLKKNTGPGPAAHYPELCMSWIDSLGSFSAYKTAENSWYRTLLVNCPVNVTVKNSSGEIVGRIVNDEIEEIEDGIVARIDEDGQKTFVLPQDEEYTVEVQGTDEGTVNYTVEDYNFDTNTTEKVINYKEIEISEGTEIVGTVSEAESSGKTETTLQMKEEQEIIEPDEILTGDAVLNYSVEVSSSGNGNAIGGGNYVSGEFAKVTAEADEGYEFSGWYQGDTCVSTEVEYRFAVTDNTSLTAVFIPEIKVSFEPENLTLHTGETATLNTTINTPDIDLGTFTWSSSDQNVAVVDENGNVTGVAIGVSTITAMAEDGRHSASCDVVVKGLIGNDAVSDMTDMPYTGEAITQTPVVTVDDIILVHDTDYTITYTDNINAGTATVTITGIGNYEGTVTKTFTINPAAIDTAEISAIEPVTYTGKEQTPVPTVKVGEQTLKKDTDYTVSYANNTNIGTATVTITGKGNYTGTLSKTFTISAASIANATVSGISNKTYTGSAITQNPAVKVGDKTLTKNTDYTVSYQNNTNVGTATVTITGKGNYASKKTATFKINKAAQSITVKAKASRVAVGKTTTVSITGNKGKKSYKSSNTAIATVDSSTGKVTAKKVGTIKITATSAATSNYNAASKTVTIKIVPAATASLTAANQVKGIKLTWKKVTGANGYKIYRGSTLIKTITSGSTVTFADTKANTNGTKYTYKVIAKATTGDSTLSRSRVIYRVSRPAVSSVTNSASKKMTVKWGKNAKANGYQIQYSTDKNFKSGNKAVSITSASTVSKVIGSLTKGKTYYVRIRTYKTVGSTKYWSIWSAARSVKISK